MKRALPRDPDLLGSINAINRAATNALKLARTTHTPCYVVKDGSIINTAEPRGKNRLAKEVIKLDQNEERALAEEGVGLERNA